MRKNLYYEYITEKDDIMDRRITLSYDEALDIVRAFKQVIKGRYLS
jgi:hypothetical protein